MHSVRANADDLCCWRVQQRLNVPWLVSLFLFAELMIYLSGRTCPAHTLRPTFMSTLTSMLLHVAEDLLWCLQRKAHHPSVILLQC